MPIFGEFETVGDPIATPEEGGRFFTVWKARKTAGGDTRDYVVKCHAPPRRAAAGEAGEKLERDQGLEFLESIKQMEKARREGGENLAPVYGFGISELGAWYATAFYAAHDLKFHIEHQLEVDSEALRHVIHNVVLGCLALKRSRGYSHGNLRASNVFLAKQQPLRVVPLHLTDPYPAGAEKLAGLDARGQEDFKQIVEANDLLQIGLLILQLVEGRIVSRQDDHQFWDLTDSLWKQLGKRRAYWQEWHHKLVRLDAAALATINLEALEREFRPDEAAARRRLIYQAAAGVAVVGGIVALVAWGMHRGSVGREKAHRDALAYATNFLELSAAALEKEEFDHASNGFFLVQQKLADWPKEPAIQKAANGLKLTATLQQGTREFEISNYVAAAKEFEVAAGLARDFSMNIRTNAEAWRVRSQQSASSVYAAEFKRRMDTGDAELKRRNYEVAALEFNKAGGQADSLADAGRKRDAARREEFANKLANAMSAQTAGNVTNEIRWLKEALAIESTPDLLDWWDRADRKRQEEEQKQVRADKAKRLASALERAEGLLQSGKYAAASEDFDNATVLASDLGGEKARERKIADEGKRYAGLLKQAAEADAANNWTNAIRLLQDAVKMRPDPKLDAWLARARSNEAEAKKPPPETAALAQEAIDAGNAALARTNYTDAEASFSKGQGIAVRVKSPGLEKEAKEGVEFVQKLVRAQAARAAGDLRDEADLLEAARKLRPGDARLTAWLADSRARRDAQATKELAAKQKQELETAFAEASTLLEKEDYARAEKKYAEIVTAAESLKDARAADARQNGEFARFMARAQVAANTDEQITNVQKALEARKDDKAAQSWLAKLIEKKKTETEEKGRLVAQADFRRSITNAVKSLQNGNYTDADSQLADAEKLARDLKPPPPEDPAAMRLFAKEMAGVAPLAATNAWAGFRKATNAYPLARGSLADTEKQLAQTVAARLLVSAWEDAIRAGDGVEASNRLALAGSYNISKDTIASVQAGIAAISKWPAQIPYAGLVFVKISGLPGAGRAGMAYVSKYEVSQEIFRQVAGTLPAQPVTSNQWPAHLSSAAAAAPFIDKLNTDPNRPGVFKSGMFQLPSVRQYLALSTLNAQADFEKNADFEHNSNLVISMDALTGATSRKEIRPKELALPLPVTEDAANPLGLVDVLGNAAEWTSDNEQFGISHQAQVITKSARNLVKHPADTEIKKLYFVGFRPIWIPRD